MIAITRTKRRRFLVLLACVALLAFFASGYAYWSQRDSLADFVDQDLRKLDDAPKALVAKAMARIFPEQFPGPRKRLNSELKRILPEDFTSEDLFFSYQSWYLWKRKDNDSGYILFQGQPLFMIPGQSAAAVHFLGSNGEYQGNSNFSTGWRIDILDAAMVHCEYVDDIVIEIKTGPSLNGSFIGRQIYGIFENHLALLRMEDLNGKVVANTYRHPNHQIGPSPLTRTEEEWENLLYSPDRRHVLEGLTWVAGVHSTDEDLREGNDRAEQISAARLVAKVRTRPLVRQRILELADSGNVWFKEAAMLAREQLPKDASPP